MNGSIRWFARNTVAANLLMVCILIAGAYSLFTRIPLEVFPSIELERVNIRTSFPGAPPSEVEEGVTVRIEEAIQDIEGIEKMISTSSEGSVFSVTSAASSVIFSTAGPLNSFRSL